MTFIEMAKKTLDKVGLPLSAQEIWDKAWEYGIAQKLGTQGKTPAQSIGARIYTSLRDDPKTPFCIASKRPTRFGLKVWNGTVLENSVPDKPKPKVHFSEKDLHPLLAYYASNNLNVLTKTIDDKKGKNKGKGFAEWMNPDMVGLDMTTIRTIDNQVRDFSFNIQQSNTEIYSFELKREISFSTLRRYYFQAVSNSRWANKGYLVAAEIQTEDKEFMDELSRLSEAYGIGVLHLSIEDPNDSTILYESKRNPVIDWRFVDFLYDNNSDFKEFIVSSSHILQTGTEYMEKFDTVLKDDELEQYLIKMSPNFS